ncbi:MAG: hypothetical protein HRU28_12630 [Rhizobiales bacterium]|nr:hypothetical protein [Hyphomicrobiales bacterium]
MEIDVAQASNFFGGIDFYHISSLERFLGLAISGATGFDLGWFFSPQAKIYRRMVATTIASVILLVGLFNDGYWGIGVNWHIKVIHHWR